MNFLHKLASFSPSNLRFYRIKNLKNFTPSCSSASYVQNMKIFRLTSPTHAPLSVCEYIKKFFNDYGGGGYKGLFEIAVINRLETKYFPRRLTYFSENYGQFNFLILEGKSTLLFWYFSNSDLHPLIINAQTFSKWVTLHSTPLKYVQTVSGEERRRRNLIPRRRVSLIHIL